MSRSLRFRRLISRNRAELGHIGMLLLNTNRKPHLGSQMHASHRYNPDPGIALKGQGRECWANVGEWEQISTVGKIVENCHSSYEQLSSSRVQRSMDLSFLLDHNVKFQSFLIFFKLSNFQQASLIWSVKRNSCEKFSCKRILSVEEETFWKILFSGKSQVHRPKVTFEQLKAKSRHICWSAVFEFKILLRFVLWSSLF